MDSTGATNRSESNKEELRDIYHTAFVLRQKLVPDVVPAILHYAGLFERHTYTTGRTQDLIITKNSAPSTCLITSPLQSSARVQNPVRKVVFAIQSCDQGWASNRDAGSWTWFTAGILPKSHEDTEPEDSDDSQPDRFLDREREVYRNEVASGTMKTHIVEWTIDSENDDERRWISALQNGDKIAVRAWAQYSGWHNKVRAVSIAIYTTAVV